MKFEIYLLCLFTENKELKLNAFLFNRTIYNIHVYGKRRSNCLISLLLSFIVMLLQKRKVGCQSYTKSIIKRNKEYQRAIVCSQSDC